MRGWLLPGLMNSWAAGKVGSYKHEGSIDRIRLAGCRVTLRHTIAITSSVIKGQAHDGNRRLAYFGGLELSISETTRIAPPNYALSDALSLKALFRRLRTIRLPREWENFG